MTRLLLATAGVLALSVALPAAAAPAAPRPAQSSAAPRRANPFAQLMSFGRARAEEPEDKDAIAAEEQERDEDAARADEEDGDGKKGKKAKKAKSEKADEGEECEECDGTGEDDEGEACEACDGTGRADADEADGDGKKGKGKKAGKGRADEEDGDAEKDGDEREAAGKRAGIKAERARWSNALSDPRAVGRQDVVCHMLSTTGLSSDRILTLAGSTAAAPAAGGSRMADRAAAYRTPNAGGTAPPAPAADSAEAFAQRCLAAHDKAQGRK